MPLTTARPRRSPATYALIALALISGVLNLAQYFYSQGRSLTGDQRTIDRFHQLFYNFPTTWQRSRWLGVLTLQNPNDVWIHQEIITEVKPDFIIETGTAMGGSALLWAMVLEHINPRGKVITLDIADQVQAARSELSPQEDPTEVIKAIEAAQKLPLWRERVEFIKGSSTDPAIVVALGQRVKGQRVLVILDSDHSKAHVMAELKAYAPMVSVGSYVIVQDTNVNGHPVLDFHGPGPMEAVEEFLATNNQFIADRTRERLLFTMHPKGYLKRIKPNER